MTPVIEFEIFKENYHKKEMMNSRNVKKGMQEVRYGQWKGITGVLIDIGSNQDTAQLDIPK